MNVQDILTESLEIVPEFRRESGNTLEDEQLARSIAETGVQQPLIVTPDGDTYKVIKGNRRLDIARHLGIPKLPCVVLRPKEGTDLMSFMGTTRFMADHHRQDLLPSQKATMLRTLIDDFGVTKQEIKDTLGITVDTIGNYLDVLKFIPPVVAAIDKGDIKMHVARAFRAYNPAGQEMLLRRNAKDFTQPTRTHRLQEQLREIYPPGKFRHIYANPDAAAALAEKPKIKRIKRVTKNYSPDEKKKLIADATLNEREINKLEREGKAIKAACMACSTAISAILRDEELHDLDGLDENMMLEFEAVDDAY